MRPSRLTHLIALGLAALTSPALAGSPMTAAEFEAYVTGKTLYFGESGQDYGAEEYLSDRRVRWSYLDGNCRDGIWYEEAGQICFLYEDRPDAPQCWQFFNEGGSLRAQFEGNPDGTTLYEARQTEKPMLCYGPDVGV